MALGSKPGSKPSTAAKRARQTFKHLYDLEDRTEIVSFRLDPEDKARLQEIADREGLKLSQLVKSWIRKRLREED